MHAVYAVEVLGLSEKDVAEIFAKSRASIYAWVKQYKETGQLGRKKAASYFRKFDKTKRQWLVDYFMTNPVTYLDEACTAFHKQFDMTISKSMVWSILHAKGLTWKTLERRAMTIRQAEIARYTVELNRRTKWLPSSLVFVDEVSFDIRDARRTKGYGLRGQALRVRGQFCRAGRVSLLVFIGINGVLGSFHTEGTFTRAKFIDCCKQMIKSANINMYPGTNSVWIMDGAKIHCHPDVVHFIRSRGVRVIFLPAYCPFYNPIEVFFAVVKGRLRRTFKESVHGTDDFLRILTVVLTSLRSYNMRGIYRHCGYSIASCFNPRRNFSKKIAVIA